MSRPSTARARRIRGGAQPSSQRSKAFPFDVLVSTVVWLMYMKFPRSEMKLSSFLLFAKMVRYSIHTNVPYARLWPTSRVAVARARSSYHSNFYTSSFTSSRPSTSLSTSTRNAPKEVLSDHMQDTTTTIVSHRSTSVAAGHPPAKTSHRRGASPSCALRAAASSCAPYP